MYHIFWIDPAKGKLDVQTFFFYEVVLWFGRLFLTTSGLCTNVQHFTYLSCLLADWSPPVCSCLAAALHVREGERGPRNMMSSAKVLFACLPCFWSFILLSCLRFDDGCLVYTSVLWTTCFLFFSSSLLSVLMIMHAFT